MKALCWHGKGDIRCDSVPEPRIEDSRDVGRAQGEAKVETRRAVIDSLYRR